MTKVWEREIGTASGLWRVRNTSTLEPGWGTLFFPLFVARCSSQCVHSASIHHLLTWPSARASKMGKYDHIAARTDDDIGDEEAGESGFEPSILREGDHPVM